MSKIFHCISLCTLLIVSSPLFAKGQRYGGTVSLVNLTSIDYQQGESGSQDVTSFGLVYTTPIDENNNRWRWWFGLNYIQDSITAPPNGIYQEVTSYELRAVPQYALNSWGWLTPYVGAGLSAGMVNYKNRWVVDSDGFKYGAQLEDISQFELRAVATIGTVVKLGSDPNAHIQIIPQISYLFPVYNDGIGGLELSLSMLF
ncbi:porin family protein [Vibrio sp. S4M6]|uniref:porin family protein n=1 Tax=Vibrio sinus TaxID=2946865 RepID=UPI00202A7308|nr:porin family protein [Vibrio sinus]MCL9780079.1 porin family protein [Vibrio sinus]